MAKFLNKNNFLIWEEADGFQDAPFTLDVTDDAVDIVIGQASVQFLPLLNDEASYGFNLSSFQFTFQDNPGKPAFFDPVTEKITYYPPAGVQVGQVRQLKYRVSDMMGNESGEATVNITIQDRATAWRPYEPSAVCLLDGNGDNTGMKFYNQLEKFYLDDLTPYVPQALKVNDMGNADYIPEARDEITCPLPGAQELFLYVWNSIPDLIIQWVTFTKAGVTTTVSLNLGYNSDQPKQLQVEPGTYDSIEVMIKDVTGDYVSDSASINLGPGTGGSGGGSQLVPGMGAYEFVNVTMGSDFGADISLF